MRNYVYLKKKYRSDSYSKNILQIAPNFLCICWEEGRGVVAALINLSIQFKVFLTTVFRSFAHGQRAL